MFIKLHTLLLTYLLAVSGLGLSLVPCGLVNICIPVAHSSYLLCVTLSVSNTDRRHRAVYLRKLCCLQYVPGVVLFVTFRLAVDMK